MNFSIRGHLISLEVISLFIPLVKWLNFNNKVAAKEEFGDICATITQLTFDMLPKQRDQHLCMADEELTARQTH